MNGILLTISGHESSLGPSQVVHMTTKYHKWSSTLQRALPQITVTNLKEKVKWMPHNTPA